jgi:hypothetical protein
MSEGVYVAHAEASKAHGSIDAEIAHSLFCFLAIFSRDQELSTLSVERRND